MTGFATSLASLLDIALFVPILLGLAAVTWPVASYLGLGCSVRLFARSARISRGLGVAVTLVGVAGFAIGVSLEAVTGSTASLIGTAIAFVGVWFGAISLANLDWYRAFERAPIAEARLVNDGPARLAGRVRPADDRLSSPLSDEPCVCRETVVLERRLSTRGRLMVPVAVDRASAPFLVDDGTGPVLVDPVEADLQLGNPVYSPTEVRRLVDGDVPPRLASFLARHDVDPRGRTVSVRESRLEPGDEVTVVGDVRRTSGREEYDAVRVVADGEEAGAFVIAAGSPSTVASRLDDLVRRTGLVGLVTILAGVALTLAAATGTITW